MIMERVNRFFGYEAVVKVVFRQGARPRPRRGPSVPPRARPARAGPGPARDPDLELRTMLESLAGKIAAAEGSRRRSCPPPFPSNHAPSE
jgi:hypothetical protein